MHEWICVMTWHRRLGCTWLYRDIALLWSLDPSRLLGIILAGRTMRQRPKADLIYLLQNPDVGSRILVAPVEVIPFDI